MTVELLYSPQLATVRLPSYPLFTHVGTTVGTVRDYGEQITVGKPGRCPEKPVLLIELFDNSGSVLGGNDPVGQRFLEAFIAISRVGAKCQCGKDLTVTLHFDTPTSGDLEPTSITKVNQEKISRSLAIPPDGRGVSLLGPSLIAAQRLAEQYRRTHNVVLVVLSDFLLFDDFLSELIAFPGDVEAVVLQATPPQELIDAPTVTVTHVNYGSRPGIVARAIFTALTRTRPQAKPLPVEHRPETSVTTAYSAMPISAKS